MACSTNFPAPREEAPSGDSYKSGDAPSPDPRAREKNVHHPPTNPPRPLAAPLVATSRRRMSEQSSSAGAGPSTGQLAPPSATLAILLVVFDSQGSPGRPARGVLHLLSSLPAHSLPLYPPAVSLIPRAFLARPGERPHQLEQFSAPRYGHHVLSTARVPSLQRESESAWTPLGPLAGLIDGTAYTTATVPTLDLEDARTKSFLEELARNMPAGRLPFDARRAHVLYLAPIERRYAVHPEPNPAGPSGNPAPRPSVRQRLTSHQPAQAAPTYPSSYPPYTYQPQTPAYPLTPVGYRQSVGQGAIKQEAEASPLYRPTSLPGNAYRNPGALPPTSTQQGLRFPATGENPYVLSQGESPEDNPSPNRSSDTTSPSPQSASLSPSTAYGTVKRASSRLSPAGSTAGPSRAYAHRSTADDIAFPYIASYLASRFPDVAAALERRGDYVPSLNGPWWFQTHTSAFMHVCSALDMPTMRETQAYVVPPESLPGPPSPQAPWDGRITADDVARWFGSFPKSNNVARSTIRNHVGVLRRWQTLWERTEMQYFRDRGVLARPLPGTGPERDVYLATELLGVLGFVFARNSEERRNLLLQGMHPQALERCANRWPWGEVEEKIVRFFPEFGPKRRPRDPAPGPSGST
ncbi:hypothetical protein CALCODRAFT_555018 [Calocera cornea HHB12733]|uniref:Uncharacterized protein n=1 Tax=Calocera cornea HHB12733 TaxID=1353952 RepID=A0A165GFB3_9BASI|nr:hypothetical protein CALCODRAFT_555018 [Calocera cornea HHB12733]